MTVDQALQLRDDAAVRLEGTIQKHLQKDQYLFGDGTGTIVVEIDDELWAGRAVGPTDRVILSGEIDKDWNSIEVDVDRLEMTGTGN